MTGKMNGSNKIIFLTFVRKPGYFEKRFFVDELQNRGFEIELWDLSALFGNEVSGAGEPYVKIFADRLIVASGIESNRSASFVLLFNLEYRFLWIYRLLTRCGCRLFFFSWGAFPSLAPGKTSFSLKSIPAPAKLFRGAVLRAFRYLNLVKNLDGVLYAGEKAKSSAPNAVHYIPVNLPDFEEYCDLASGKFGEYHGPLPGEGYVVFLDCYLPFHPDFKINRLKNVDPEKYRTGINAFFEKIESCLGKPIVIAAHPKAEYPPGYFGSRHLIRNETARLVMNCHAVISHYSTSTSYAVLWKKQLVFVYSDDMKNSTDAAYMVPITNALAEELAMPIYNIDHLPEKIALHEVQDEYYERYRKNYITTNTSCEQRNRDIFLKIFSERHLKKQPMKSTLIELISLLPFGKRFLRRYSQFRLHSLARSFGNPQDFFSHMYETRLWGSDESASGPGSTLEYTENIRKELPLLFRDLGVKSILHAPCGDYHWFRYVDRDSSVRYQGADIVEALIKKNRTAYGNQNTSFSALDIRTDRLPKSDLWLCRDALFHFSNMDIFLTIKNFLDSDIPYLLTSSHTDCEKNIDIPTGSFRLLNLEKAPFSFCKPERTIDDWVEGFPVRKLCLWKKEDLRSCLEKNKHFVHGEKERTET